MHLLDVNREVEKRYNPGGWPFLMVVDRQGKNLFRATSLLGREMSKITPLLTETLSEPISTRGIPLDGATYMQATLRRSGELQGPKRRDRFPSVACGPEGRVVVVFTSNRDGNSDIFLRVFDGREWSADRPVAAGKGDEYDGCVLVARDGRVWLSWTSNAQGGKYNIFVASLRDASEPMNSEQLTAADDDAMHARMACDGEGHIWVTYYKWHKMGPYSRDKEVYARRYDGTTWSDEIRLSPADVPTYEDHTDPAIAARKEGVVVAWSWDFHHPKGYTQHASEPTIFVRSIGTDLHLDRPRAISGHHIDTTPAVAVGHKGDVWCAWDHLARSFISGAYRKSLCVRRFDLTSETRFANPHRQSNRVVDICTPSFTVSPNGGVTLVWAETEKGNRWVLKKADFDGNQDRWPESKTVVSDGNPRFPSAAYDSEGNLWIAYSAETALGREISVRTLRADE